MLDSPVQQNLFFKTSGLATYHDFGITAIPSTYFIWDQSFLSEEASDEDIIQYAAKSPAFAFLNEPDEDIYTVDDGEAICH